ncbi:MAG: hypothetical protein M3Q75_14280 [Gemmatimonadota bacterium]|nr:hypothetical protein [Gemmatimonadota bacterium]
MGWVRVDDAFYDHRKFNKVTVLGMGVWIAGLAYCNRNLTDGFIPNKAIPGLVSTDGLGLYTGTHGGRDVTPADGAWELLRAELWSEGAGGWQVHDYHDYQPSAQQVRAERDRNAERKAAWRAKASHSASPSGTDNVTTLVVPAPPNPNPNPSTKKTPSSSRAARIPDDFAPTAELRQWASENTPDVNVDDQTTRFVDYWRGVGGQRGRKLDWPGTWRNWLRKAQDDLPRARPVDQSVPEAWR